MSDPVIYKKYANRRIYDTSQSTYVTLEAVAAKVRAGDEIRVVDAKTREDVTAFVLTQIILEQAKSRNLLLPVPVLHLIIRYGDNLLGEFLERYLQPIVQTYLARKQAFDRSFEQWFEMGAEWTEAAQRAAAGASPFADLFGPRRSRKPARPEDE